MSEKEKRAEEVNEVIRSIADCGRRFFYCKQHDRYAEMQIDERGKIWFVDDYTGKRVYTHFTQWSWSGFSHGGTLRDLIISFRNYISKGIPVPLYQFGPWPDHYCNGDLWGYGDDMEKVRETVKKLWSADK